MAEESTTKLDEGTEPKPEPPKDEGAEGGSEGEPKPAAEGQGGEDGEPSDKHGQPGINREKYQRDMKAKDDKIAELQAQLDEKSKTEQDNVLTNGKEPLEWIVLKTEEGRAELKDELDKLKAEMADERVSHKLEMAGCRNVKAAKALLDDYEGDVAKLKEACPYLFSEKQTGSTGLKSDGDAAKASEEKVDKILSKYKR